MTPSVALAHTLAARRRLQAQPSTAYQGPYLRESAAAWIPCPMHTGTIGPDKEGV
jgi:hypothetical protein